MIAAAPIDRILEGLSEAVRTDSFWSEFLERYSPAILRVVRQYESDDGRAMDCFLFVCDKISDDGFRRLLSYQPDARARFRTWLNAVVANLCIDWRRKEYGRLRPLKAIAELPELDRSVFRSLYELGMTRRECLHTLHARFPGVTEQQIAAINARLFSLLTSRQRWRLGSKIRNPVSLDDASSTDRETGTPSPVVSDSGPESAAQTHQDHVRLEAAMSRLPSRQRLLLHLRYEQDLTLKEVARLTQIPDTSRAHREIRAALAALAGEFESPEDSSVPKKSL